MEDEVPQPSIDEEEVPKLISKQIGTSQQIMDVDDSKTPFSPASVQADPKLETENEEAIDDYIQDQSAADENLSPSFES